MITIKRRDAFAESIADALKQIDARTVSTFEKIRAVNALAKATILIEDFGTLMTWQPERDTLTVNSDSGIVYHANASCQCLAHLNNKPCWHKAAYNLIRNYVLACDRRELDQTGQTSTLPLHETATTFEPGAGVRA